MIFDYDVEEVTEGNELLEFKCKNPLTGFRSIGPGKEDGKVGVDDEEVEYYM